MMVTKLARGLLTGIFIAWFSILSAQTLSNDGAVITAEQNAVVTIQGSVESSGNALFQGAGTIEVSGDIQNMGSTGFSDTATSFVLNGSASQTIGGTQSSAFYNLKLDNASGTSLNQEIFIREAIEMTDGTLDLNGQDMVLGVNGRIDSETNTNRIFGTSGSIRTTRSLTIPTGNTAALGLDIKGSGTLGETEIIRRHSAQSIGAGSSIERSYELNAANAANLNMDVLFNYFPAELNGQAPANLQLFQTRGVWRNRGGTSDPNANTVEAFGLTELGLMTLSSDATVSLSGDLGQANIAIYPNPVRAGESVQLSGLEPALYTVKLFDIHGRALSQQALMVSNSRTTSSLQLPVIPAGMYILQFKHGNEGPISTKITIN